MIVLSLEKIFFFSLKKKKKSLKSISPFYTYNSERHRFDAVQKDERKSSRIMRIGLVRGKSNAIFENRTSRTARSWWNTEGETDRNKIFFGVKANLLANRSRVEKEQRGWIRHGYSSNYRYGVASVSSIETLNALEYTFDLLSSFRDLRLLCTPCLKIALYTSVTRSIKSGQMKIRCWL